jgi:hypothetical protein
MSYNFDLSDSIKAGNFLSCLKVSTLVNYLSLDMIMKGSTSLSKKYLTLGQDKSWVPGGAQFLIPFKVGPL